MCGHDERTLMLGGACAGVQVAVIAMAAPAWEVRNAASLTFTGLIIRMLGFRNLVKVHIYPSPAP